MQPLLDNLARDFRSAVLAGDHPAAERSVVRYAEALQEIWVSMSESERAASSIAKQAEELLVWARNVTIMQRALTSEQLTVLEKASRYLQPGSRSFSVQA